MTWQELALFDGHDTSVRQETQKQQAEATGFMAELTAYVLNGLQERSQFSVTNALEAWAAAFTSHAAASLKCAFDLLVNGYPAQSLALLRGVMEDISVVTYLSRHPEEINKLNSEYQRTRVEDLAKDTVKTGAYRKKLQDLGNQAMAEAMEKLKDTIDVLHLYAHPSLYAIDMAMEGVEGVHFVGFYEQDNFRRASYAFVEACYFTVEAVASVVGDRVPAWSAAKPVIVSRILDWIKAANEEAGIALPKPTADGTTGG